MRPASLLAAAVGLVLVGLGIVYLVVACQNLPGFLGPTAGETAPRTPLGIAVLLLGLLALSAAAVSSRRGRAR